MPNNASTSTAVPKEQQTAYQRWEMSSFGEDNQGLATARQKKKQEDSLNPVSQILESVRKEAYTKGMQEGFVVGMAQAREQAQAEREQFVQLMHQFSNALETCDTQIADQVLGLALDIAKAMMKTKINVDATALIPVVMDAIHYLPHVQQPARILVNHADAHILREYLAEELDSQKWQVLEDNNVERGGCLVETGANQIDANNTTRWKRITEALAQKNDWLMP